MLLLLLPLLLLLLLPSRCNYSTVLHGLTETCHSLFGCCLKDGDRHL